MKSDLSKVKVGDKIWTIQEGWTKVAKIDHSYNYPIRTENDFVYLLNGTLSMSDKYPSAFLECPFKEQTIEKDTVVWYKDAENFAWKVGYYSHFINGQHYCFNGSKKSTETDQTSSCYIVTTENPLRD